MDLYMSLKKVNIYIYYGCMLNDGDHLVFGFCFLFILCILDCWRRLGVAYKKCECHATFCNPAVFLFCK